jgi:hypothetical protein
MNMKYIKEEFKNGYIDGGFRESYEVATAQLAAKFHENWRKTRLRDDGSYEPRQKQTRDESWIEAHGGADVVDIANTSYEDLPADWQAENRAAAEVVVGIIDEHAGVPDLSDARQRNEIGNIIHKAWLERNTWATGGDLDVPFSDLPIEEQDKDIEQITVAAELFR